MVPLSSKDSSGKAMSTAEYAKHRGVSGSYIRRLRRRGVLVINADGAIDARASDEMLDGITHPVQGGKRDGSDRRAASPTSTAASPPVISVHEAVRRERLARARLAEIELGEESSQLTRVEDVDRAVFTLVRQALNQMQGMSGRLRKTLAAESDPLRIAEMIDADVANICADMRDYADRLIKTVTQSGDESEMRDADADADAAGSQDGADDEFEEAST